MGAYTEIVDFTFTANETSRTFSGLSITKDDFVKVVVTHINNATSQNHIRLFPNTSAGVAGNETNSNYTLQVLEGSATTVFAVRASFNELTDTQNTTSQTIAYIKISENNKFNIFANCNVNIGSNVKNRFVYTTSSNLTFSDPITSLAFKGDATNGISIGSRIQIYKLAATKVADITVASNTTQVDISNLSIDKDSEYLLVGDWTNNTSSTSNYFLTPNDLTTQSGYHAQLIQSDGSSASAFRLNEARIARFSNERTVAYHHIKLSNIGAFTYQNYGAVGAGTSSIRIGNNFGSSTSEAITSITKLNIIASVTNAIQAGSRFTLYKLYE